MLVGNPKQFRFIVFFVCRLNAFINPNELSLSSDALRMEDAEYILSDLPNKRKAAEIV